MAMIVVCVAYSEHRANIVTVVTHLCQNIQFY